MSMDDCYLIIQLVVRQYRFTRQHGSVIGARLENSLLHRFNKLANVPCYQILIYAICTKSLILNTAKESLITSNSKLNPLFFETLFDELWSMASMCANTNNDHNNNHQHHTSYHTPNHWCRICNVKYAVNTRVSIHHPFSSAFVFLFYRFFNV